VNLRDWIAKTPEMTQEKLALMVGCGQPTIARIIAGGATSQGVMESIFEVTAGEVTPNDIVLGDKAA
jgi:predicted transcriptional regulator